MGRGWYRNDDTTTYVQSLFPDARTAYPLNDDDILEWCKLQGPPTIPCLFYLRSDPDSWVLFWEDATEDQLLLLRIKWL